MSTESQKHRKWEVSGHIDLSIVQIVLKLCCVYEAFFFLIFSWTLIVEMNSTLFSKAFLYERLDNSHSSEQRRQMLISIAYLNKG